MPRNTNPRQRILDTASRLFYEQGYNATGINQVLEEANVAKASLYLHYGSKDELGVAYLQAAREEWFAGLRQAVSKKDAPLQKLLACFDFLEQNLRMNDYKGCKFINMQAEIADSSPAMQQQILQHKTKLRRFISQLVLQAAQGMEKARAAMLADTVFLLFEGAIVESKICKDVWPVKAARKTIRHLLETDF